MATLSAVTTPNINVNPNRDQSAVRDNIDLRERLSSTKTANESLAKVDADTEKNYKPQQEFISSKQVDPSTIQTGNRRGNLLDLTV